MHRINRSYIKMIASLCVGIFCVILIIRLWGNDMALLACKIINREMEFDLLADFSDAKSTTEIKSGFENNFLQCITEIDNEKIDIMQNLEAPSQTNDGSIAVNLSALSGKYKNYSGTAVINNTKYDISKLLYSSFELPPANTEEPYILIYHTHTSEKYFGGGSVVDVGNKMASEFEKLGYKTIHLTEAYDDKQFSGAYSRSAVGVEKILQQYPSIKMVFDVHRDAITDSAGVDYRPITETEGKKAAQVMLVCGTDEKGLKHPDWRENFKFALNVSRTMGQTYENLSRPVNLRGDRFNTHFTKYSFIIEVGSEANTLDEAENAAVFTARSIIKTIEK